MTKKQKIVTIGGGSGQYILLSGLSELEGIELTSIVSMVDSGGSTGRLRDEFGILPPGDALKCVLALSANREVARKILLTKFQSDNRLNGHNAGNMLIAMLAQYAGNFPDGINALGEILNIKGRVLPVTVDKATLVAELENGEFIYGETAIDIPTLDIAREIKRTFLVPHHTNEMKAYGPVLEAIRDADYIIVGPGDLYSSITPNFLVPGVVEELKNSKAKLIYIVNIMTKFGESDNYTALHFVEKIESLIGKAFDYVLVNDGTVDDGIMVRYREQKASMVLINEEMQANSEKYIIDNFLSNVGEVVRHDSSKLANSIDLIVKQ